VSCVHAYWTVIAVRRPLTTPAARTADHCTAGAHRQYTRAATTGVSTTRRKTRFIDGESIVSKSTDRSSAGEQQECARAHSRVCVGAADRIICNGNPIAAHVPYKHTPPVTAMARWWSDNKFGGRRARFTHPIKIIFRGHLRHCTWPTASMGLRCSVRRQRLSIHISSSSSTVQHLRLVAVTSCSATIGSHSRLHRRGVRRRCRSTGNRSQIISLLHQCRLMYQM
jgi:hypothetical protein